MSASLTLPAPAASVPLTGPRRLLLLSVSAGAGHGRAADAIAAYARDSGATAHHIDVMTCVPHWFRYLYTYGYLYIVKRHPQLWAWLYRRSHDADPRSWCDRLRRRIESWCTRALLREIDRFAPDAILCTHFLPAERLLQAHPRTRPTVPVWIQVTDFDVHRLWIQPGVAGYFVATDALAGQLRARGVAPATIHVTGIPVMPNFVARPSRFTCAKALGLDPHQPTVILMGGGAGLGQLDAIAARVLNLPVSLQLIVMTGRNTAALASLAPLVARYEGRLAAVGYTDAVERLMVCADIAITKAGGLSIAECLALGLPMLIHHVVPGQEAHNAQYVLAEGAAIEVDDVAMLASRLHELLSLPATLAAMRARCTAIARPRAAPMALALMGQ